MKNKADFEQFLPNLVKLDLFNGFSEKNEEDRNILYKMLEDFSPKTFAKDEVILKEGEEGDEFYILVEGKVQVSRRTPSGEDSIAIAELTAGQQVFFGEAALLGLDSRSATVTALSDCLTLSISGKKFIALCDDEPKLGYRVFLCLARRMKASVTRANNDVATLYEALFQEIEGDL